ncbi:hypothetical protein GCM10022225_21210 [Plantactinospora mayteni]|uniref:Uncharacterized protein n=1 Tax=Plantactinospora mayteni TaxID=566021 RepID=A0ABQ4ENR6_9ACTN|nr:hypothetical protein Pma05_28750 [Plantactinospora mayteni]
MPATEFRRSVRSATVDARIAREARAATDGGAATAPKPANRYDGWNGPTRAHPTLNTARAGNLTPAQWHRARHAERV